MADLLMQLEVTSLYKSWWYMGFLVLFCLNTIVCTLTRLTPKLKRAFHPSLDFKSSHLTALKICDSFPMASAVESAEADMTQRLSSRKYRLRRHAREGAVFLLARKRTLGLFGSDIVHLGILVILLGGIISGITGIRDQLNISEGEIMPVPGTDFSLRLDKFETEFYDNRMVKDWKSTLTVLEGDRAAISKTIEVNHPLSYKGYQFYQSAYGWDWRNPAVVIALKKKDDSSVDRRIKIRIGEKAVFDKENLEVYALRFLPDFVLGENNEGVTRSLDPNNPAVNLRVLKDGEEIFAGWLFSLFPDFSRMHSQAESDLTFQFVDFEAGQFSGIQYALDPGVNFIWAGCVFLMLGLFIAFYWPPREIRVILEDQKGKTGIVLGGVAAKNKDSFKEEFEKIAGGLRSKK